MPPVVSALTDFSVNENVAALAEVPPCGTFPALVTAVDPSADEAAITVKSEASNVADMPTLIAFFHLFKFCTSYVG